MNQTLAIYGFWLLSTLHEMGLISFWSSLDPDEESGFPDHLSQADQHML